MADPGFYTGTYNGQSETSDQYNTRIGAISNPSPVATAPSVADIYGSSNLGDALSAAESAKTAVYDPAAMATNNANTRSDVLKSFQSQLDSLDQGAATARARITTAFAPIAAGRVGNATALESRRGLLGSDFGNAQTDTVNQANNNDLNNQIGQSDQEFAKQKSQLLQFIAGEQDKEIALRQDASQKGADAKIQEIQDRTTRANASAQMSVKAMLASGINDPTNPNYSDSINKIASTTGLTKDTVTGLFNDTKTAAANAKIASDTATANLAKIKAETGATLTPEEVKAKNDSEVAQNKAQIAKLYSDINAAAKAGSDTATVAGWVANIKSGNAKLSDITGNPTLKNAVSTALSTSGNTTDALLQTTKDSFASLKSMVDKNQGFTGAVGSKLAFGTGFGIFQGGLPGSSEADFNSALKKATGDITLSNLKLLHGVGRITDREFQALTNSVTSLSTHQSEDAFKKELNYVIDTLNKDDTNGGGGNTTQLTGPDGTAPNIDSLRVKYNY